MGMKRLQDRMYCTVFSNDDATFVFSMKVTRNNKSDFLQFVWINHPVCRNCFIHSSYWSSTSLKASKLSWPHPFTKPTCKYSKLLKCLQCFGHSLGAKIHWAFPPALSSNLFSWTRETMPPEQEPMDNVSPMFSDAARYQGWAYLVLEIPGITFTRFKSPSYPPFCILLNPLSTHALFLPLSVSFFPPATATTNLPGLVVGCSAIGADASDRI